MNILVTGGAGFIGSHIVDELIVNGHNVIVLDNFDSGNECNLHQDAVVYRLDLRDDITDVFQKESIDAVCHVAAKTNMRESISDPRTDAAINIVGLLNLYETCIKSDVKTLVFSSTGGALYGDVKQIPTPEFAAAQPISPYGISKMAGERYGYFYSNTHGMSVTILRYSNVYGPRLERKTNVGAAVLKFMRCIKEGKEFEVWGDGEQTRDFVFVSDIARANRIALEKANGYQIYNTGSGVETSINVLIKNIEEIVGKTAKKKYLPALSGEVRRSALDVSKVKEELGWNPSIPIDEGLTFFYRYLAENVTFNG